MEHAEYVAVIRSNVRALGAVARTADLDRRVPTCPAWTLRRLVGHLAGHYQWVSANLDRSSAAGMFPVADLATEIPERGIADWLELVAFSLADKLETVGPDQPCWTWVDDQRSGFWARRSAHETVMHAWDGVNAAGSRLGIETAVAVDGIDEYLEIAPNGFWATRPPTGDDERIQLIAPDGPAGWHLHLDGRGTIVSRDTRGPMAGAGRVLITPPLRRPAW